MRTLAGSSQGWPTAGALLVGGNFDGVPDIEFPTWLPPGDDGPQQMTKVVRRGGWTLVLHTGPWGTSSSVSLKDGRSRSMTIPTVRSRAAADFRGRVRGRAGRNLRATVLVRRPRGRS